MPSPDDLRQTLHEIAHRVHDVPDMPVDRGVAPARRGRATPVLLTAGLLAVLLVAGVVGAGLPRSSPVTPAVGPTRAIPSPAPTSSPSSSAVPSPKPSPSPTATAARDTPRPGAAPAMRPMTPAEVSDGYARCLTPAANGMAERRRGKLQVRWAVVQAAVGHPVDGTPRRALLFEDADGYFDCSSAGGELWVGKGGDHVDVDRSAAGFEVPTLSGGTSSRCTGPRAAAVVSSAVVLRTPRAAAARVTVRARGGSRTAVVPTRDGYVYVATRVGGKAAWHPSRIRVELLDASGHRLRIQPYAGAVTERLEYPLEPC